ncbi:MAG: mechanosensitive ion channel family protein [Candidatus Neomarinimicrobiota bacterium]
MKNNLLEKIYEFGEPLLIIIGAVLLGWIFKKFIHGYLHKLAKRTNFKMDDLLLESVARQIIIWLGLAAVYYITITTDFLQPYSVNIIKLVVLVLIVTITFAISKFLMGMIDVWSANQARSLPSTKIFVNLVRAVILVIGFLVALDYLGVSITPMLTALGVGGLAISLALKDTLSDVFAGLHILLSKKVKTGDFIELESGQTGNVTNITWRNTTILERTNNVFNVPNSRLSNAIIKNFDAVDKTFSARVPIGVAYESDLDHVEKVTIEVAKKVVAEIEGHDPKFIPFIRYSDFGESSINFKIFFKVTDFGAQYPIIHNFIKQILVRYNEEGINIPFPIRTLYHMNNIELENN